MNFLQSLTDISLKKVPLWSIGVSLGILFCILGYRDGQFTDIMKKAVMICLECIGIG